MRRLLREQEGALPPALTISRDANTGAGQGFTDLAAAVQLRLRVAIGLQTLTVKLRLLPGRNTVQVRGSPPFPAGVAQQRQQQFRKLPGNPPQRECESPSAPFHAPVAQSIRAGGFEPPGCR